MRLTLSILYFRKFGFIKKLVGSDIGLKTKPRSGTFKTSINIFRSFVALGVLALPYACRKVQIFWDFWDFVLGDRKHC